MILDSSGPGQRPVACSVGHDSELSASIICNEFLTY
jgi:hypothetical protein